MKRKTLGRWRAGKGAEAVTEISTKFKRATHIVFYDCETVPGESGLHEAFLIGSTRRWLQKGEPKYYRAMDRTPAAFVDRVLAKFNYSTKGVGTQTIVAHNGQFDFMACGLHPLLVERGFELDLDKSIISESSKPFHLVYTNKPAIHSGAHRYTKTLTVTSSSNFFADSLANLGKTVGSFKGSFQFHSGTKDHLGMDIEDFARSREAIANPDGRVAEECELYCAQDVEILRLAWESLEDFIERHELGAMGLTIAATAMSAYRTRFLPEVPIELHDNPDLFDMEADAYKGGAVVMLRQLSEEVDFAGYQLDFVSMYASVMRNHRLPYRLRTYFKSEACVLSPYMLRSVLRDDRVCAIARVTVDLAADTVLARYPKLHDDTLAFPTGRFETTLAGDELAHAVCAGAVSQIHECAIYDTAILFDKYVDVFGRLKEEYAASGNAVFESMAKLFNNSLYGKWGQTIQRFFTRGAWIAEGYDANVFDDIAEVYVSNPDQLYVTLAHGDVSYRAKRIFGQPMVSIDVREASKLTNMAIAACITAAARTKLFDAAEVAGPGNALYADTDSWVVTEEGYANIETAGLLRPTLGFLMPEMKVTRAQILGMKHYALHGYKYIKSTETYSGTLTTKRRHKGIRIQLDDQGQVINLDKEVGKYRVTVFGNAHPAMLRDQATGAPVETRWKKAAPAAYRKGTIGEDGAVTPIHL